MRSRRIRKGSALLMSMIVLVTLAAWAVSIHTISGTNLQLAENQRKADIARACAESGLEVMRYWLSCVYMPSSTSPSKYLSTAVSHLRYHLDANSVTNITVRNNGSILPVTLDSATGQTFSGQLATDPNDPYVLELRVTGTAGPVSRTIGVAFNIEPYEWPIFDFGLATKGALHFPGNPTIRGATENWEADIYIESPNIPTALFAGGNVNLDGDISIGNPNADADFQQDVLIAGEQGQTAIDNHVFIGADPVEFPVAQTEPFVTYATGDVIDVSTDTSNHMTLTNVTIKAGTNPTFAGNIIIEGIMFVEAPNIITFESNVQLHGLIAATGDVQNPGTNHLFFGGNFATFPYPSGAEFDAIRGETGASILAPAFATSFAGNFSALDGVVAVSGADFIGNVNATVKGTIINYSENPLQVAGNASMTFDRSASTKVPAGFDFYRILNYIPSSYSEVTF
ncbi:MAG: pilus assembly PilX N-terminal domain-containing protein [Planctomycetota bacterium]